MWPAQWYMTCMMMCVSIEDRGVQDGYDVQQTHILQTSVGRQRAGKFTGDQMSTVDLDTHKPQILWVRGLQIYKPTHFVDWQTVNLHITSLTLWVVADASHHPRLFTRDLKGA